MKNNKANEQIIGCDVHDCKHCNCDVDSCQLEEIKVCSCSPEEEKEATMCDSYRKKDSKQIK